MTKKNLMLTIDEELLETAKKRVPNMSKFFEECLKQYLGIENNLIPTSKMNELVETIGKCQLELYLMNERSNIEEAKEKAAKQEINLAWRQLYTEYRDTKTINPVKLERASEVLNVSREELSDIVEVCFVFSRDNEVDVTEWQEVYEKYGE
jgi:post-segregation antitoxin (ccd killing protein)